MIPLNLGDVFDGPRAQSDVIDDTMGVRFRSRTIADRARRKIIAAIEACESPAAVTEYIEAEAQIIQALGAFDPAMPASIAEAATSQAIWTNPDRLKPRPAEPGNQHTKDDQMAHEKFSPFKKVMFKDVTFYYPKLDQPYRFNNAEKRSEPCPASATNAGYSMAWRMSPEDARDIVADLKAHYTAAQEHDRKLPAFSKVFGLKKMDEDGKETTGKPAFVQFTGKKRAMNNDGKENKPPVVVGPDLEEIDDKAIWTGSEGSVRVLAFPTVDPDGIGGISLLLDAVQVTAAVYGGDNLEDDFGPAQKPSLDDYMPATKPADTMVDDDIGF